MPGNPLDRLKQLFSRSSTTSKYAAPRYVGDDEHHLKPMFVAAPIVAVFLAIGVIAVANGTGNDNSAPSVAGIVLSTTTPGTLATTGIGTPTIAVAGTGTPAVNASGTPVAINALGVGGTPGTGSTPGAGSASTGGATAAGSGASTGAGTSAPPANSGGSTAGVIPTAAPSGSTAGTTTTQPTAAPTTFVQPTAVPTQSSQPTAVPTQVVQPTATEFIPSATPSPTPTFVPTATATPTVTPTATLGPPSASFNPSTITLGVQSPTAQVTNFAPSTGIDVTLTNATLSLSRVPAGLQPSYVLCSGTSCGGPAASGDSTDATGKASVNVSIPITTNQICSLATQFNTQVTTADDKLKKTDSFSLAATFTVASHGGTPSVPNVHLTINITLSSCSL